jgi:L-threonylcarbamoyladenylate synthase
LQVEDELIKKAVALLRQGELVAFPTETVYGLGADATSEQALAKLYAAKGRPLSHPVIVHLHALEQVNDWAENVPESFWILARKFWPGPLTMIVKRSKKALDQVTGGQPAVGLRMPGHPVALALLKEFGEGIAAPSANKFGHVSPTSAKDVEEEFAGEVSMVLDGGACRVGIESTIVDLSQGRARILRPGMILEAQIEEALHSLNSSSATSNPMASDGRLRTDATAETTQARPPNAGQGAEKQLRSPGNLPKHYAPTTPLDVVPSDLLEQRIGELCGEASVAVISFGAPTVSGSASQDWIIADKDPILYARAIYGNLRALDRLQRNWILVEEPPDSPEWIGIRDRLKRASMKMAP